MVVDYYSSLLPALMALPSTTLDSKMFYKKQETTPTPIPIVYLTYECLVFR